MNKTLLIDIYTIAWKEWKEVFQTGNDFIKSFIYLLIFLIAVVSIISSPATNIKEFTLDLFSSTHFWTIIPCVLILIFSNRLNSIFEERKFHTLPSLLATRIPNYAIVIGKVSANTIYIWGATLLASMLSLIKINFISRIDSFTFYSLYFWLISSSFCLLVTILMASLSIIVSLYAKTELQFQLQYLLYSLSSLFIIHLSVIFFANLAFYIQETVEFEKLLLISLVLCYFICFTFIDSFLLFLAIKFFKRNRLMLN